MKITTTTRIEIEDEDMNALLDTLGKAFRCQEYNDEQWNAAKRTIRESVENIASYAFQKGRECEFPK